MPRDYSAPQLPAPVETALCEIFGAAAREVRVVPNSWFARLHGRADATTRRNVIYLRGSLQAFLENPELMLHEYFHVLHQWRPRRLTVTRYLLEWAQHGYWNNRFEREARHFTATHLRRMHALMAAASVATVPG